MTAPTVAAPAPTAENGAATERLARRQLLGEAGDRAAPVAKQAAKAVLRSYGLATAARRPLPDFLLIGTKRGGTTSLWNYLLGHPLVLPMWPARRQKSCHYFDTYFWKGERWYRSHFSTVGKRDRAQRRWGERPVAGEASPFYMWHPRAAERVAATAPDVKVIVMLRNPVDRAYSHWKERVGAGVEPLSFEAALDQEAKRLDGEYERLLADPRYPGDAWDWYSYLKRGEYLPQLERWCNLFPRRNILVIRSEDFYADPASVFAQICGFLALPVFDGIPFRRFNETRAPQLPAQLRQRLEDHFRPHNQALAAFLDRDLGWDAAS